ncbi:single-stranded DNA-binding protein [Candidatus Wolfebacteria bacterium RIFCSPHIGHO2_01_FULL_48_22]|uniref:Single-stranded DNA-binding protein n=1 Tax=Candidatus Wolfebacteria bacterium RIFCSPHIGHO2_01_FULL_48_22 TaxID=1802555 RepID=A0A1F8DP52_9BACT|nr:MAG: single-stranded DNA-binding protein [Candidatus Wolfebacteria bacterium RIFCSPHIGHO2_01_FULL_48_22]
MYLNKALIIGNLTRDPELRSLPSGIQVASFGVATNRVYKDKEGNKKEQADFHNVVVFGRQAETSAQYLKKGQQVMVEGRMQTRSWDDKTSGEKKYRTEIVADRVQFGAKGSGSAGGASKQTAGATSEPLGGKQPDAIEYPQEEINPEDIPF